MSALQPTATLPDAVSLASAIEAAGHARLPGLLSSAECRSLAALFEATERFRSHVVMARYNFGRGEYKYFAEPLPPLVARLREMLYPPLAQIANRWRERLGEAGDYPVDHAAYRARCHAAGQARPTPLLLRYRRGDYNCLHQDLYGEEVFPLQVTVLLSAPGSDFDGGEFVLTEQRPRMQSRARVVSLARGDAVVFPVRTRPVAGTRGDYRVNVRHGVSEVHRGERHALGVIFHDAA